LKILQGWSPGGKDAVGVGGAGEGELKQGGGLRETSILKKLKRDKTISRTWMDVNKKEYRQERKAPGNVPRTWKKRQS